MEPSQASAPQALATVPSRLVLYYVQQDIDFLHGRFLTTAVIAASPPSDVAAALVAAYPDETFAGRLTVTLLADAVFGGPITLPERVGLNAVGARALGESCYLLTAAFGEDYDL